MSETQDNMPEVEGEVEDSPIMNIVDMIEDPGNSLTLEQKTTVRELTGDVSNTIKVSLINLLMDRFNRVATYDGAIQQVLTLVLAKASILEPDELLSLLAVLTKTSAVEAKSLMDVFKKNGDDVGEILKEIQKLNKGSKDSKPGERDVDNTQAIIELSPEKADKVARLLEKLQSKTIDDANRE